jgi:hypothetical protein
MTYSLFQLVATGIIGAMLGATVAAAIVWHLWEARERGYTEMLMAKDKHIAAIRRHLSPPAAGPSSDGGTADLNRGGLGIVTSACPTCGGPEVDDAFSNTVGAGFRVCASCGEEWWTDIAYPPHKPTRYLTAEECRQRGGAARAITANDQAHVPTGAGRKKVT